MCEDIYEGYRNNPNVVLLDNDFSCLEYDEFVHNFKFIVCSRYHGIVHAYRNFVPAIILGWAIKYVELASRVGQERYVFNIASSDTTDRVLCDVVNRMALNCNAESRIIKSNVMEIQKNNCFDYLDKYQS